MADTLARWHGVNVVTSAALLAERLQLQPHPEGGWYRELHRSSVMVTREDGSRRCGLTQIIFLLPEQGLSRWHRVIGSDETWQFIAGDSLELWTLPPLGGTSTCIELGGFSIPDEDARQASGATRKPLTVVPADWWQAGRCLGHWSLVSCCVGPGFEFQDFQLLRDWPQQDHPSGALPELL